MATFIIQGRFSAQALRGLVAKPEDRSRAVQKLLASVGGKLKDYYMTTGENDFLIIAEAPDGEDAVVASMVAAASGTVSKLTTNRAWSTRDFKKMAERAKGVLESYKSPG